MYHSRTPPADPGWIWQNSCRHQNFLSCNGFYIVKIQYDWQWILSIRPVPCCGTLPPNPKFFPFLCVIVAFILVLELLVVSNVLLVGESYCLFLQGYQVSLVTFFLNYLLKNQTSQRRDIHSTTVRLPLPCLGDGVDLLLAVVTRASKMRIIGV